MSYSILDPDAYETVFESHPCHCGGLLYCTGNCTGWGSVIQRPRPPEEVARIKAEKRRVREDAILAEADTIRARREALPIVSA